MAEMNTEIKSVTGWFTTNTFHNFIIFKTKNDSIEPKE